MTPEERIAQIKSRLLHFEQLRADQMLHAPRPAAMSSEMTEEETLRVELAELEKVGTGTRPNRLVL